jgi:hypothetical protein
MGEHEVAGFYFRRIREVDGLFYAAKIHVRGAEGRIYAIDAEHSTWNC